MRTIIKNIVKYIKPLYELYNKIGNIALAVLKIFVKPDKRLILFVSFGGQKYDDSPRVIYESMKTDWRFKEYKLIWAFVDPENYPQIPYKDKVRIDTLKYFSTALAARVWVTNSSVERGLNFKGKNTLYFNTWHGTPIKKMGTDIAMTNKSFRMSGEWPVDIMTAQGQFEVQIYSRVFHIDRNKFLLCGLPRNDILANYSRAARFELRKRIGIPETKKAILYMPTFREFERDFSQACVLVPPLDLNKWRKALGNQYIFLFRAHYEVAKVMNIDTSDFVLDVTVYPALDELMIASDVLISDYSSVFFDYAVMTKPMLFYTYDYKPYSEKRGMYFDIREELNGSDDEDGLIDILKSLEMEKEIRRSEQFRDKYINYFGSATKSCLDRIYAELQK